MKQGDFKISFCVVCMNRLHQLKQTIIQNIADNSDYGDLEFVVLDYNSKDGMEEWVMENLADQIKTGRVVYYKTTDPESWSPSHSKNLAFKLATGEILCSIWADYYTGAGFAQYVNNSFKDDDNIVLTPIDFHKTKKNYAPPGDVLGKVAVKKSDFLTIKGFDERMNKHGFEDYDFINRLEMIGVSRVIMEEKVFLQYIQHDNDERYSLPWSDLKGLFVRHITPSSSDIIMLYKNNCFIKGIVIDNYNSDAYDPVYAHKPRINRFEYSLNDLYWQFGVWKENNVNEINLKSDSGMKISLIHDYSKNTLSNQSINLLYNRIDDPDLVNDILTFKHFYDTRYIMEQNLKNEVPIVNDDFGKATVFCNFTSEPTII